MAFDKFDIIEQDMNDANKKIKGQLIQDLYPGREVTPEMRKIKATVVDGDFGLDNVFRDRKEVTRHYMCENISGEKALIAVAFEDDFSHDSLTTTIKKAEVFLPFANREFLFDGCFYRTCYTKNLDTGKMGKYVLGHGFTLEEIYDNLVEGIEGEIATIGNKTGRVASRDYDIAIKYDELVEIDTSNIYVLNRGVMVRGIPNSVVLVKLDGKWGAYCYLKDYHSHYISSADKEITRRYLKKRFIAPLFDKIEIHTIDDAEKRIVLRVWLNNKVGLLEVYSREFICPIVFDAITKWEKTCDGGINDYGYNIYGYIDGEFYRYSNGNLVKEELVNIEYPEPYMRVREKIEKK